MKIYKYNKKISDYFRRNNKKLSSCHKENHHRYKIYKLFDAHVNYCVGEFSLNHFIADLLDIKDSVQYMNKKFSKSEKDFRSGRETYGYEDEESIIDNIMYISGKWACQFRTRWLLDLLSNCGLKGVK